jgi:hypothetical protein
MTILSDVVTAFISERRRSPRPGPRLVWRIGVVTFIVQKPGNPFPQVARLRRADLLTQIVKDHFLDLTREIFPMSSHTQA